MSICEENCAFTEYIKKAKKAICSCYIKFKLPLISEIKVNKNKFFTNFKDIRNIGNFKMLSCYKLFLNKNNILKNSANYMLVILFILSIYSIFIFYCYDYKIIKKYFNDKKYNNKIVTKNIMTTNSKKPIITRILKNIKKNETKRNKDKINKNKNKRNVNFMKKKIDLNLKIKTKNMNRNKKNLKTNSKNNYSINQMLIDKNLNKKEEYETYNDYELYQLEYDIALTKDKRSFIQLYISLLKMKHILFFTFFQLKDYNSYMIKIYIFFFTFAMNYVVSAMFYSDSTMHKIYIEDGSFDITYQLPQMLYSFIISSFLRSISNLLGLYERDIAEFKKKTKRNKYNNDILFKIKFKITLFFIIYYILLFFFWIYLGCFCAVYKNTQIHLLLDVSSSFALSLVTPFIIILLPCLIRILSLKNKKGKNKLLKSLLNK